MQDKKLSCVYAGRIDSSCLVQPSKWCRNLTDRLGIKGYELVRLFMLEATWIKSDSGNSKRRESAIRCNPVFVGCLKLGDGDFAKAAKLESDGQATPVV
jgi:hypothetical protein